MTEHPENWSWPAAGPIRPGPCVLVDIDGVLADGWHRQHFLRQGRKDWKNFFANAGGDAAIPGTVALLAHVAADVAVVLLTARPDELRQVTIDWLGDHGHRWDLLIMRGPGDRRYSSPVFKRRAVDDLRAVGFEPRLAIDDDQRNVEMFRDAGIDTLYVHSGYYDEPIDPATAAARPGRGREHGDAG